MAWVSWINVVLGTWLVVAAFLFSHATGAEIVEDLIAGLFVALTALWAARAFRPAVSLVASWTVVLAALWVVVAPFALGYERESIGVENDILVGLVIVALGIMNVASKNRRLNAQASAVKEPGRSSPSPRGMEGRPRSLR